MAGRAAHTPGTTANLQVFSGTRIQVKRLGLLLSCVVSLAASAVAEPRSIASVAEKAYQKNPELHFYEQEIAVAQGDRLTAGTWPNPDLSGQIGGKIYKSLGGKYLGTGTVWTVSLTQTFEFPGRVTLRKAIADKQIALARIGLEQFRLSLRNRIEMLCYRLLAARDRAAVAIEVAQRFRDLIAVLVQRELDGPSPLIEMRILEGNAAILNRRATQAQIELRSTEFELNLLRGVPMNLQLEVASQDVNLPLGQLRDAAKLADDNYRLGALPISAYTEIQSQYLDGTDAIVNTRLNALQYLADLEYLSGEKLHDIGLPSNPRSTLREKTKRSKDDQRSAHSV